MTVPLAEAVALLVVSASVTILPLSASGHTALLALLAGTEIDARYVIAVLSATWIAPVIYFRRALVALLREGARAVMRQARFDDTQGGRDARTVGLATVSMVAVGIGVSGHVAAWAREPSLVGGGLVATALALGSTFWAPEGDRDTPTWLGAFLVGAVQGAAELPGLSRPAVALASLLWLGVRAERAFELSFLTALPAGLVTIGTVVLGTRVLPPSHATPLQQALALISFAILATGVSLLCLRLLRTAVTHRALPAFSLYLVPLAFATLAWGYARP